MGQQGISGHSQRVSHQYGQLKLRVTHLLDQILVWQRQQRSALYQVVSKLNRQYSEAESLIADVDDDTEVVAILGEFYGGKRFHVATQESYIHAETDFVYKPLSSLCDVDAPSFSRSAKGVGETLARECDDACRVGIVDRWSMMLHEKMKILDSNLLIRSLLNNVYEFQQCEKCIMERELCAVMEQCGDMMNFISKLKPHFVRLRTLINTLYKMHAAAFELHLLELLLKAGTYDHCQEFKQHRFPDESLKLSEDGERGKELAELSQTSDRYVMEKYGHLFTDFMDQLKGIMPIHECCSCLKLVGNIRLRRYEHGNKVLNGFEVKTLLKDYENHFGRHVPYPVSICNACDTLLKQKSSLYCCANAMWPVPVPSELACLNTYEQQLVAICKCYLKIIRLQPYRFRGLASSTFAKGVKGLALHLPLPSGTLKKACEILEETFTLPDYSKFVIEVDGLPNVPKRLLFRSLVDISAVMTALKWLKMHNRLYKNAVIDDSFLQLGDDHLPLIIQRTQSTASMEEIDAVPSVVDGDEPEQLTDHRQESSSSGSERLNVHDAHIAEVIDQVLVETEADNAVEAVLKQRRVKNKVSSFIDVRNAEAVDIPADAVTSGVVHDSAIVEGLRCQNILSGAAIKKAVSECNFPIPYVVPYKRILLDQLKEKSSMLMRVPGHDLLENYSIVELEPSMPKGQDLQLFAMKPVEGDPLRSDDPNLDVACFPLLFPDGNNGLCHARRTVSPAYFYQHRFEMSDRRFCRDQCCLLDTALRKDIASIHGSIYTMLNTGRFGKLTAGQLKKGIKNPEQSEKLERNVLSLLGSVVGSVPYWIRVRRDLEAMVEELGAATFFPYAQLCRI